MSSFYKDMQQVATDLLKEFGEPIKVTREGATVGTGVGLFVHNMTTIDGAAMYQTAVGNKRLILNAISATKSPEVGDLVLADKVEYTVKSVSTLRPTNITIFYNLEVA